MYLYSTQIKSKSNLILITFPVLDPELSSAGKGCERKNIKKFERGACVKCL